MRVLIMGSGEMTVGSALDLDIDKAAENITLVDIDQRSLDRARGMAKTEKIEGIIADVGNASRLSLAVEVEGFKIH